MNLTGVCWSFNKVCVLQSLPPLLRRHYCSVLPKRWVPPCLSGRGVSLTELSIGHSCVGGVGIQARWKVSVDACGETVDAGAGFEPSNARVTKSRYTSNAHPGPGINLQHLKAMIDEARQQTRRQADRSAPRQPNEAGEWPCNHCGQYLCRESFYGVSGSPKPNRVQIVSKCKDCIRIAVNNYHRTLRGNIVILVGAARQRSKLHVRNRSCTLTHNDILVMLWTQEARCAYSGIAMEILIPNSHWRMSLERKNNLMGYSRENCVLIASEFNSSDYSRHPGIRSSDVLGTAQWSADKVQSVLAVRHINLDVRLLGIDIEEARLPKFQPRRPRIALRRSPNSEGEWRCGTCGVYKAVCAFHKNTQCTGGLRSSCMDCSRENRQMHAKTFRRNMLALLASARRRSKDRQQAFALTLDCVLEMLWLQAGRCCYSGIPWQYKQRHTHWRMSLERLDNFVGYTRGNCVLIAVEFNTSDHSRKSAKANIFGTAQWSRRKASYVWGSYLPEDI
ncbi:unnamed protein product [Polarella glacialis]|uniref:Uncharacterized protein n=1 Tax=Polarella glacialis TaxID=89957 RepID=A0A813LJ84_POLGL|nr:unnamed protein product [Polarella glacialis]